MAGDSDPLGTGDNRPSAASQLIPGLLNLRGSFRDCVSVHCVLLLVARCSEELRSYSLSSSEKIRKNSLFASADQSNPLPNHLMTGLNGYNIQTLRIRRGLKSKEVAARLGISPSYYSEMEKGRKPIPENSEFLRNLAAALEFSQWLGDSVIGFQKQAGPVAEDFEKRIRDFVDVKSEDFLFPKMLAQLEEERLKKPHALGQPKQSPESSNPDTNPEAETLIRQRAGALADELTRRRTGIIESSEKDFSDRIYNAMEAAKSLVALVNSSPQSMANGAGEEPSASLPKHTDELLNTILDALIDALLLRSLSDEFLAKRRLKSRR